jgi:predicted membrane GTPase involved in stress response
MDLEKERGITIMSKWAVMKYKDYHINIVGINLK